MNMNDSADGYGVVSKANHWLAAAAVLVLLGIGLAFEDLPRGDERLFLQNLHISIGMAVVLFLLFRVGWRMALKLPRGSDGPVWEQRAARVVHVLLLASIVVLAITGPLIPWSVGREIDVFGWFSLPSPLPTFRSLREPLEVAHTVAAKLVLLPTLVIHVAATIKHALIDRDGLWRRMTFLRSA